MSLKFIQSTTNEVSTDSNSYTVFQSFSISLWVKLLATPGAILTLAGIGNDALTQWINTIQLVSGGIPMAYTYDGAARNTDATQALRLNSWYHLFAHFQGGVGHKIYIDGIYSGISGCGTISSITGGRLKMGSIISGGGSAGCELSDVAMWSATLTEAEAKLLAAGVSPLDIGSQLSALEIYWPLDTYPLLDQSPKRLVSSYRGASFGLTHMGEHPTDKQYSVVRDSIVCRSKAHLSDINFRMGLDYSQDLTAVATNTATVSAISVPGILVAVGTSVSTLKRDVLATLTRTPSAAIPVLRKMPIRTLTASHGASVATVVKTATHTLVTSASHIMDILLHRCGISPLTYRLNCERNWTATWHDSKWSLDGFAKYSIVPGEIFGCD